MAKLKETLLAKIQEHRPRTQKLVKEHGDLKIGEVTVAQAVGGARGVRMLVTDISYLDPFEGIRFRGKTIPETFAALPKVPGSDWAMTSIGIWIRSDFNCVHHSERVPPPVARIRSTLTFSSAKTDMVLIWS